MHGCPYGEIAGRRDWVKGFPGINAQDFSGLWVYLPFEGDDLEIACRGDAEDESAGPAPQAD